jgi:hypothetical protein
LCSGPPAGAGVYIPNDQAGHGAPPGKLRLFAYCLCSDCEARPDAQAQVEALALRSVGELTRGSAANWILGSPALGNAAPVVAGLEVEDAAGGGRGDNQVLRLSDAGTLAAPQSAGAHYLSLTPHSPHTLSSVVIRMPKIESGKQTKPTISSGHKHNPITHIPSPITSTAAKTTHPAGAIFFLNNGGNVV